MIPAQYPEKFAQNRIGAEGETKKAHSHKRAMGILGGNPSYLNASIRCTMVPLSSLLAARSPSILLMQLTRGDWHALPERPSSLRDQNSLQDEPPVH